MAARCSVSRMQAFPMRSRVDELIIWSTKMGFEVNLRIGGIVELLQRESVWGIGEDLLSFGDRTLHPGGTGSKNDFRTQGDKQNPPLQAHGFWHSQNDSVPFCSRHEC